jgi:GntR family phosphonate transport system transcriptional regulator
VLAQRFGAHQHTVLKAISHLQSEGIVRISRGRGTFVVLQPIGFRLGRKTWFEQNLLENNHIPARKILAIAPTPAPDEIAVALDLEPGAPLLFVTMLGEADGMPVYLGRHYFSLDRLPGLESVFHDLNAEGRDQIVFSDILGRAGVVEFQRKAVKIRGRLPEASEMHHLQIGRSIPLLETVITLVDANGLPLVHAFSAYCSDRIELVLDL